MKHDTLAATTMVDSIPEATSKFALLLAVLYALRRVLESRKRSTPMPPGPPGLPILGNVRDMPTDHEWLTFTEWGKTYGEHLPFPTSLIDN